MKKLALLFCLLVACANLAAAAELKVGHFDLKKVIAQSEAGKQAREKYLQRAGQYQDEINQRTAALNTLRDEIKKQVEALKEGEAASPALMAKDKEAAGQFRDLQRLLGGYQDELKLYDAELTRGVLAKLQPVLAAFAEKGHYDYLFKLHEGLVYAASRRDLSDELVKAFDKATAAKK